MCFPEEGVQKGFRRLQEVSSNRSKWATLPITEKLDILEEIEALMVREMDYEDFIASGKKGAEMRGYDVDNTVEGEFAAAYETLIFTLNAKKEVDDMIKAYKIRAGLSEPPKKLTKGNFETRKAINGQVVTKTFPITPDDHRGFYGHFQCEVWMDSSKIQDESQVEAFAFEKAWEDAVGKEGGLMIVLGAGNQPMLSFVDIMHAMYIRNFVVYFKQHPIRRYMNDLFERIYAPLITRGYLAVEAHSTNERCAALIYHPDVDALHMTGGKATHDLLVWGLDSEQREHNLKANNPKLKNVTSELGAITPWVIVPGKYTKAEMKSQAGILANFVKYNASCNCNAPKCVVVAEDWDQKEEFLQMIEDELANAPLPVAYYPNVEKRWKSFSDQYPDCKKIESKTGLGVVERKLRAGGLNDKPLLLPYLKIETAVDLETVSGKESASKEFAFKNEPFAPVLTFVTLQGTSQKNAMKFSKLASLFCNDYLFGSLSGTITAPPSILDDDSVQTLVAEMKYGCLCINNWSGLGYVFANTGMWGAFPGETLDAVESGIGKVGNTIAIPHFEKLVVSSPIVHVTHMTIKKDLKKEKNISEATTKYALNSSVSNLMKLIGAVLGVDLLKVGLACTSVVVASCAYFLR